MKTFQQRREPLFGKKRDKFYDEIEGKIQAPNSLLDVGCGGDSPVQFFKQRPPKLVGVDGFMPSIKKSKAKNIHDSYQCADLMQLDKLFVSKSFDCVLSIDVIEHFDKDQGLKILGMMEKIASKRVIIVTPNGYLPQEAHSGNLYQEHLSGWDVKEMEGYGYKVTGLNGWKPLLGQFAQPNYWPAPVCRLISRLTQPLVRNNPQHAFHILCVKDLSA